MERRSTIVSRADSPPRIESEWGEKIIQRRRGSVSVRLDANRSRTRVDSRAQSTPAERQRFRGARMDSSNPSEPAGGMPFCGRNPLAGRIALPLPACSVERSRGRKSSRRRVTQMPGRVAASFHRPVRIRLDVDVREVRSRREASLRPRISVGARLSPPRSTRARSRKRRRRCRSRRS